MSDYYNFSRKVFEEEVNNIALMNELQLRDITDQALKAGQKIQERLYQMTTKNSSIRVLIYSSLDIRSNDARTIGADAVRINLWINTNYGKGFKKFKRHYRTTNVFKNLLKTIEEVNEYVTNEKEISKWVYGIKKGSERGGK
jgi:hypothetical protein